MSEKNVLAYFRSPEEAQHVRKELESMGINEIQVDQFSKYPGSGAEHLMNPITGNISSQADMMLGDISTRDIGILTSVDVSASGMSDAGTDWVSGRNILLTAVMDESQHHQALQAIKNGGGLV